MRVRTHSRLADRHGGGYDRHRMIAAVKEGSTAMFRFLCGMVIGGMIAFVGGYNLGRGALPLSDAIAARSKLSVELRSQVGEMIDSARAAIHRATAPPRRPGAPVPKR